MEVQTQSVESVVPVVAEAKVATETPAPVVVPVEAKPDVAVAVEGVEVSVTDTKGGLELTPVTGLVGVLVLGLLAAAVLKLRK